MTAGGAAIAILLASAALPNTAALASGAANIDKSTPSTTAAAYAARDPALGAHAAASGASVALQSGYRATLANDLLILPMRNE